jgi:hypothetical protein
MSTLLSQVIELPHLGMDDCVRYNGVPKDPSAIFHFYGIDHPNTTRLRYVQSEYWGIAAGDEIACAADDAASGSSTCDIFVYPWARIAAPIYGMSQVVGDTSLYPTARIAVSCTKILGETWAINNSLYTSLADPGRITKFSGGVYVGYSAYAIAADDPVGYIVPPRIYSEGQPLVISRLTASEKPKVAGVGLVAGAKVCVGADGAVFPYTTNQHGVWDEDFTTASAASDDETVPTISNKNVKMVLPYDEFIFALKSMAECRLVPVFGSFEYLLNRSGSSMHDNGGSPYTREYTYNYALRPYRVIKETARASWDGASNIGFTLNGLGVARFWKPCICIDIPAVTWTRQDSDALPWSPPDPRDLTGYHLVLAGRYDDLQFAWGIWRDHPVGFPTGLSADGSLSRRSSASSGYYYQIIKHDADSYGISQPNMVGVQTWVMDLTRVWDFCLGSFEGGSGDGTMRFEFSVWMYQGWGTSQTEVLLRDWADMTRSVWFVSGSTTYLKFTFSLSLAACGATDPYTRHNRYFIRIRQYYVAVSPYASYTFAWGVLTPTINLNYAGHDCRYDNRYECAFPFDKQPFALLASDGGTITTKPLIGYYPYIPRYALSWSGSVTIEAVVHTGRIYKFKLHASRSISCDADDLMYILPDWTRSVIRIKRLSDGRFVERMVLASTSGVTGVIWSRLARQFTFSRYDTVFGEGIYNQWPVSWSSDWILVDIAPDRDSETFEVELLLVLQIQSYNAADQGLSMDTPHRLTFTGTV